LSGEPAEEGIARMTKEELQESFDEMTAQGVRFSMPGGDSAIDFGIIDSITVISATIKDDKLSEADIYMRLAWWDSELTRGAFAPVITEFFRHDDHTWGMGFKDGELGFFRLVSVCGECARKEWAKWKRHRKRLLSLEEQRKQIAELDL